MNLQKGSFDVVVGGMQVLFLLIAIASFLILIALGIGLTFHSFAFVWTFGYLFLITTTLRKQVAEHPTFKRRMVLNWAVAAGIGVALATLFMAFIA